MKDKGLGRGLGALFGDDYTGQTAGEETPSLLPLHRIEPNPDQPRKDFDAQELQSLADSLAQHGMLSPLAVRDMGNGYYQIIAGERRWRAARLAGFTQVPVLVVEADDRQAAEMALVENLQRQDLNPVEEARGYRALMDSFGLTQDQTAGKVGRSRSAVANALRLLNLSQPVLELLEIGQLSPGHARAVLSLEPASQQEELARQIVLQNLSVRQAEALAARMNKPKAEKPPSETQLYWTACSETLSGSLGRGVHIKPGRKKGVLELEYYDLEDFQTLYQALSALGKGDGHHDK